MPIQRSSITALMAISLSGCGTYAPQLNEVWEPADVDSKLVFRIQKSIYCEIRTAIYELGPRSVYYKTGYIDSIPDDWGIQTTLQLQVDETTSINASVTPIPSTHFSLPLSGKASSQAVRIDKYYSFFSVKGLKKPFIKGDNSCNEPDMTDGEMRSGSSYLLSGQLGIRNWMKGALDAKDKIPSSTFPNSMSTKLDVLSYDIKFIVISDGSANPLIKLSTVTAGGGIPLIAANRTRTHDLLVTLGPTVLTRPTPKSLAVASPAPAATSVHTNGEIQQSLSSALQSFNPAVRP